MVTPKKQGFTLVELVCVIAVLAILMCIAIPSVVGMQEGGQQMQEDEAQSLTMTAYVHARSLAIEQGYPIQQYLADNETITFPATAAEGDPQYAAEQFIDRKVKELLQDTTPDYPYTITENQDGITVSARE